MGGNCEVPAHCQPWWELWFPIWSPPFCQPLHTANSSVPIYHREEGVTGGRKRKHLPLLPQWVTGAGVPCHPQHCPCNSAPGFEEVLTTAGCRDTPAPSCCSLHSCTDDFNPSDLSSRRTDGFRAHLISAVYISVLIHIHWLSLYREPGPCFPSALYSLTSPSGAPGDLRYLRYGICPFSMLCSFLCQQLTHLSLPWTPISVYTYLPTSTLYSFLLPQFLWVQAT